MFFWTILTGISLVWYIILVCKVAYNATKDVISLLSEKSDNM